MCLVVFDVVNRLQNLIIERDVSVLYMREGPLLILDSYKLVYVNKRLKSNCFLNSGTVLTFGGARMSPSISGV